MSLNNTKNNSESAIEINNIEGFINENISRIEVIGSEREYVKYGKFEASIQDNGRTLKIFIR